MSHTKTYTAQDVIDLMTNNGQHKLEIRLIDHPKDPEKKRIRSFYTPVDIAKLQRSEVTPEVTGMFISANSVEAIPRHPSGHPAQAKASDIKRLRHLPLDVDVNRKESTSDQPATPSETAEALSLTRDVVDYLVNDLGFKPKFYGCSGNGGLIVLGIDLDTADVGLVEGLINHVANRFSGDPRGKIDRSVKDSARVVRLLGTDNCKPMPDSNDRYTRRSYVENVYDNPTVLTREMLERFRGATHTSEPHKCESHTCDMHSNQSIKMPVTAPFDDILEVFTRACAAKGYKIKNVKRAASDFELLTGVQSFIIDGCPVKGQTDANTLVTLCNGKLGNKCHHDKCNGRPIFDLLNSLDIKPSELSTLYPDNPPDRWHKLVEVLGNRISSVDANTMTLNSGEEIVVTDTGPVLVRLKNKTLPLDVWAAKHCHAIMRAAEAGIHDETETATNPQRLAKAVAQINTGAVVMGGWIFEYIGTGYRLVENEEVWVGKWLRQVADADCQHFLSWGFAAKVEAVTATTCANCLLHLRNLLPQVTAFGTDLDGKRDLSRVVNYRNVIWIPHTGELLQHSPRYFVRPDIGIDFVETQNHPEFDRYLKGALPEPEQQALAQELAGCIMAGDRTHQKAGYLFGAPRGGKGTYVSLCQQLVGAGNYQGLDSETLGYMFGLQDVIDKMLVVVNEAQDLSTKQVSRIKAATGNDDFTLPGKYRGSYRGKIPCNWLLVSNNIIELPDSSGAVVSRLQILDFNQSFLGREDITLGSKLTAELPAIAAWARVGYLRYLRNGKLSDNQHSNTTREQLTESSSVVAAFVNLRCEKSGEVEQKKLYDAFLLWAKDAGHDAITTHMFTKKLRAVLPSARLATSTPRKWIGISLA